MVDNTTNLCYYSCSMKNRNNIDINQPVAFEINSSELPSFTIQGSYADVEPLHADLSTVFRTAAKSSLKARKLVPGVALTRKIVRQYGSDLRAVAYDVRYGTNFARALKKKRQLEKDLYMAQSLGLLADDVCAKHRKALQNVAHVH